MVGLSIRPASRTLLALALLSTSLLASSCDKKKAVDPINGLEGVPSESQLVVWRDTPIQDSVFADLAPVGPSVTDTLIAVHDIYYAGPGQAQGMIFDFTDADRFEIFRRESGAFRPFKDFTLMPAKRFFKGHTDIFRFLDVPPAGVSEEYVGRGLVEGIGAASAPKTNVAGTGSGPVALDLEYTGPTGIRPDIRPLDSLLTMEWTAVPGAAGYWVHVYQLTNQGGEDIVRSGTPAPLFVGVTRDYLLAYLPATSTTYRWGDPVPPGGRVVTTTPLLNGLDYLVRVSAVNAEGQMISTIGLLGSYAIFRSETSYRKFPMGAVVVHPNRFLAQDPAEPTAAIPTSNPRLTIYPTGATPHR